jgi:hypothetical protein
MAAPAGSAGSEGAVNSNLTCAQYTQRMEARTVQPAKRQECGRCHKMHFVDCNGLMDQCADLRAQEPKPAPEPDCDECGHPISAHDPKYGCDVERGDGYVGGSDVIQALGPCGCTAVRQAEVEVNGAK